MDSCFECEIKDYDETHIILKPNYDLLPVLLKKQPRKVEVYIEDGRMLSDDQRKKIFATIGDISLWSGHDPEYIRGHMTWDFCAAYDYDPFSLSRRNPQCADMTTATEFISYLLDFCLYHGVPLKDGILDRTDDISRALYLCLKHRKCALCGNPADVHHWDSIGMGRDRKTVIHAGMRAISLCRSHHTEAHTIGKDSFADKYHVCGVVLDKYLCDKLGLKS